MYVLEKKLPVKQIVVDTSLDKIDYMELIFVK